MDRLESVGTIAFRTTLVVTIAWLSFSKITAREQRERDLYSAATRAVRFRYDLLRGSDLRSSAVLPFYNTVWFGINTDEGVFAI